MAKADGSFPRIQGNMGPRLENEPGKVIDPMARDEDLRLGKNFRPREHDETYFQISR